MDTATTLAVMHVGLYLLIAALIAAIIVGLSYVVIFMKDELRNEVAAYKDMTRAEKKKRQEDDDRMFTLWVATQKEWKKKYSPLW